MDSPIEGSLGGTFGGNPVAAAAALAVLEQFEKHNLPERAKKIGERVRARFEGLWKKCPAVGNVRGAGAMQAIEFVKDRATKEPAKDLVKDIVRRCYENGLLVISAGTYGNIVRTLMPLVITDEQLDEGLDVLEAAVIEATQAAVPTLVLTAADGPGGEAKHAP
jgi:4-aminobutyrate aminotransferase/(S)-3-amino-2-methylpropionate transaminase